MAHLLGGENLHLEFPTRVIFDGPINHLDAITEQVRHRKLHVA